MRENTATHYGSVAKSLHWLTVLFIFTLIPTGIIANGMPYDTSEQLADKAFLFSIHKTMGVAIFFVALLRISWAILQPKPAQLNADKPMEAFMAQLVHWLLYGSLLMVPLSGWIHHAATTGFAPIWWPFGQDLPFVPKSEPLAETAAGLHIVFERVLVLSIFLHIAGALKHHFWDKDVTLKRMLPGACDVPTPPKARKSVLPVGAAVSVWVAAIGIGGALGVYSHAGETPRVETLTAVASDWQIQEGTLEIAVTQLGSEVRGSFADWTAAIAYDPDVTEGVAGNVTVQVNIGSLTLGSVTGQALGADYFDAETFPLATVQADIVASDAGTFRLEGTLTIRDIALPLSLPFGLTVEDDVATASGQVTLDRRAYDIGLSQTDAGTLGFDVIVDVNLTALRGGSGSGS